MGFAYKYKDYSVGLSTGYLFGNLVNSSEAEFTDSLKIISSSVTSRVVVGGVFLQVGGQMNKELNDKFRLIFGASYTLSQHATGRTDTYWKSYRGSSSSPSYEYGVDSVIESKGKIIIPAKLALGVMLANKEHWKAGIDFIHSNWSNYKFYDQVDSTTSSWMLKLGGSFTPDPTSVTQTWKRVTYRAGLYKGQDIFRFNATNLPVQGFTVGLGYPIRRTNFSIGQLNASLDIGQRGTTKSGLLAENYTRFSVGVTFNDKWFIPRKYD